VNLEERRLARVVPASIVGREQPNDAIFRTLKLPSSVNSGHRTPEKRIRESMEAAASASIKAFVRIRPASSGQKWCGVPE
jgi:hypothetical protein